MIAQLNIDDIGSLLPYGILLLVYFLLSFHSELQKNRFFAVPVLGVLLFFVGLRGAMTPDMQRYREMYENSKTMDFNSIEPSFLLISRFLNAMRLDYHALFFTYSFITLFFLYLGIKNYTHHVKLSLLLYILLPGCFLNMFVEMREVCAVSIAFYATSLSNRKDIKLRMPLFLALVALSASFHYSAMLYWAIVLMSYKFITKPHSKKIYMSLLIGTLLIPTSAFVGAINLFALPLIPPRYHGTIGMFVQAETNLAESGQLLKTLIYVIVAVCFVYWQSPMQNKDDDYLPLNQFVLGVVILNLTRSFADISRLSYFFVIYQIILFPMVLGRVKDGIQRVIASYVVVLFYLAQFIWGLFYYSEEAGNYPFLHYKNAILSILR
jgi:hypothetical protein